MDAWMDAWMNRKRQMRSVHASEGMREVQEGKEEEGWRACMRRAPKEGEQKKTGKTQRGAQPATFRAKHLSVLDKECPAYASSAPPALAAPLRVHRTVRVCCGRGRGAVRGLAAIVALHVGENNEGVVASQADLGHAYHARTEDRRGMDESKAWIRGR